MKNVIIILMLFLLPTLNCIGQTLQTITNSGNVTTNNIGIGTSSIYPWGSGNSAVQIGNTGGLMRGGTGGDLYLSANVYDDGSYWRVANSSTLAPVYLRLYNGGLDLFNAPNTAVGTAITPVDLFSIDAIGNGTFLGNFTTKGGTFLLNNSIRNLISFQSVSYAPPSFTTQSTGTKIVLWQSENASNVDYALGIDASTFWMTVPQAASTYKFKWYAGTTNITSLDGAGNFSTNGMLSSGSAPVFPWAGGTEGGVQLWSSGGVFTDQNDFSYLTANVYLTSVGWTVANNPSITPAILKVGQGFLGFYTAPSAAIGSTLNFTQRFSVDNSGNVTATKFITSGGASSQFLKADGSVDETSYLPTANISGTANYIPVFNTGNSLVNSNAIYVSAGNIGIGTTNPQSKLAVAGVVTAQQVTVTQAGWSDFVFEKGYRLKPLSEVEEYIHTHKHLPDIPSETEIEKKGLDLGDMAKKQMQKIEELTCYLLEEDRTVKGQQKKIDAEQQEIDALKEQIILLKNKIK